MMMMTIIIVIIIIIFIIVITLIVIQTEYTSFFLIEDGELQAAEMKLHPILIKT